MTNPKPQACSICWETRLSMRPHDPCLNDLAGSVKEAGGSTSLDVDVTRRDIARTRKSVVVGTQSGGHTRESGQLPG